MKRYSIGEVSSHLGLSRDTLRFYEKKGIILPEKLDNGYRSYTYEDTRKLLDVMFYRRLGFSLDDISRLLYESSFESHYAMVQEKIAEKKELVRKHRQSLIHLKHLEQFYKRAEKYLGVYDLRPLSRHYKLEDHRLIDRLEIFDLCYVCQEYRLTDPLPVRTDEYFLLAAETAAAMKLDSRLEDHGVLQSDHCVYTVIASPSRIPSPQAVKEAADWARTQGYETSGSAYSGFLLSCTEEKEGPDPVHYIELYLPVKIHA